MAENSNQNKNNSNGKRAALVAGGIGLAGASLSLVNKKVRKKAKKAKEHTKEEIKDQAKDTVDDMPKTKNAAAATAVGKKVLQPF